LWAGYASSHLAVKMFLVPIQYFDWEKDGLQTNFSTLKGHQIKQHRPSQNTFVGHTEKLTLLKSARHFLVITWNTLFWGVLRASTNNAFIRLKTFTEDNLIGVVCPAHISNTSVYKMGWRITLLIYSPLSWVKLLFCKHCENRIAEKLM
jgi:hypothetical protein